MSDVNELIAEKLRKYPREVADLATRALQLAATYQERDVEEQLKGILRQVVRERGGSE